MARQLVVAGERGRLDARDELGGGRLADARHREQAPVGFVARDLGGDQVRERLGVGLKGADPPGEHREYLGLRADLLVGGPGGLREALPQRVELLAKVAPLATLASLFFPAPSTCQGPPILSRTSSRQAFDRSTRRSKAVFDSTRAARTRFLHRAGCFTAKESRERRRLAPSRPSASSGTGSRAWGMPAAAAATASASLASFFATPPGKSSLALFSRLPVM